MKNNFLPQFFKLSTPLLAFPLYLSNKKAKCIVEEDDNNTMKPSSTIDDDLELDDEFKEMMESPMAAPEEKEMIKQELRKQEIQPMLSFSRLNQIYKNGVEDEKWNGLKLNLEFKPNQLLTMDYNITIDNHKKLLNNYRVSCMSFIPFNERTQNGVMLIGRKEGDQAVALQGHLMLTDKDKVTLVAQHPKADLNQAVYAAEYTHEFDRMNLGVKYSNMEPLSISSVATLYKNIFVGCEAYKHVNDFI